MIIYSNGCSHTHVHCVEKDEIWSSLIMKNFVKDYHFHISSTNYFNTANTQNENILINDSRCGAGNDYILHTSLENITYLLKNNLKPDYVFIQWSGPNRRQHCEPNGRIVNVNLYDNVEYGVKFEPMGSIHTLHYMYLLQEFLESYNINYRFFNYMELDKNIINNQVYNNLNKKNIIDFGMGEKILTKGLINFMKENNFSCDNDGHPNVEGNRFIANEIIKTL